MYVTARVNTITLTGGVPMITNRDERRDRVIEIVVEAFLKNGEPVGSSFVSEHCGLGLKPASIRSIMKELEDDGYLSKPHTSAGRIPTIRSYRRYVRTLMPDMQLSEDEQRFVGSVIEAGMRERDADMFMHHLASALSELTDLVGVAMSPCVERGVFGRLTIVSIGGSSFLPVLTLESGMINTIRITLDSVIPRTRIEETARLLTERLQGMTIDDIRRTIGAHVGDVHGGDRRLVEVIVRRSADLFDFTGAGSLHMAGLGRILSRPGFAGAEESRRLADLFERQSEFVETLDALTCETDDVSIHIGDWEPWGSMPSMSLVSARCPSGPGGGALGVIGPARVHYPRLAALVKYAARVTSRHFPAG